MKLVLGLGNIGAEYNETRHNCGFQVIELCAAFFHLKMKKRCFRLYQETKIVNENDTFHLVKPLTYMNNSGNILRHFKNIQSSDIIVICDQMDLPLSNIRIKKGGGSAGHNGLKSIIYNLDNKTDFTRIYVGIGRPKENESIVEHVLGIEENRELYYQGIEKANQALIELINGQSILQLMQTYNKKVKE